MIVNVHSLTFKQINDLQQFLSLHSITMTAENTHLKVIKEEEIPIIIDDINTILSIIQFDLDKVAYYIIINNHNCFDISNSLQTKEKLEEFKNSKNIFSELVHDARQLEITITEALIAVTHNIIY